MSTRRSVGERCRLLVYSNWDFLIKNVLPFLFTVLVLRGIIHESMHGIVNGLTGGTYGLTSDAGNIIGGYGFYKLYIIEPVLYVNVAEYGNRLAMVIAGPASIILLFWVIAHFWNPVTLDGPCGGRNKWKRRRGIVYGLMVAGWMDAIYMLPISAFPERHWGDGIAIYEEFKEMGWHWAGSFEVFGTTIGYTVNPGYILGGIAIAGTFYYTLLVLGIDAREKLARLGGCMLPLSRVCKI